MDHSSPLSILMIKTSAIGDVIQSFPVLEYLRKKFPNAQIDWVAEQGIVPLLRAHPLLNRVIEIRTKAWRKSPLSKETRTEFAAFIKNLRTTHYDLAIDLQGNTKSAIVTGSVKAKVKLGFSWKSVREKSNLFVTNRRLDVSPGLNIRLKYLNLVQSYFNDPEEFKTEGIHLQITKEEQQRLELICNQKPQIMICFGSKWANKRFDHSTLTALLQKIASECAASFLFIFGDEEEEQIAHALAAPYGDRGIVVGNLSLPLWQALMWKVDGVIAVDSAALHLCATTHTPSFSVFGPSLSSIYKPIEERHSAVQGDCPYGRTFTTRCPILRTCATGACMRQLRVEDLFTSFKHWAKKLF